MDHTWWGDCAREMSALLEEQEYVSQQLEFLDRRLCEAVARRETQDYREPLHRRMRELLGQRDRLETKIARLRVRQAQEAPGVIAI